ncbi:MAG: hypothetical protein J6C46_11385 [Clostridia bacterium]|nr:hypothetical protein [Clostridia bacterium]
MNKNINIKKQSKIFTIFFSIIIVIALIMFSKTVTESGPVEPVFDAMSFYTDLDTKTTVTQEELIAKIGEPEKIETWNHTNSKNEKIEITTLYYDNYAYEYNFYENHLQRISINKDIELKDEVTNLKLFNLSKNDYTKLNNTGSALRYYNCGVNDLWIWNISDNIAKGTKITYTSLFE